MDKIYVIEYDNDELYEDHMHWTSEFFFVSEDECIKFLEKEGFSKSDYADIEGYYPYERFEENEWWEYTHAKPIELKKKAL